MSCDNSELNAPLLKSDSLFFSIAPDVEKIINNIGEHCVTERTQFSYRKREVIGSTGKDAEGIGELLTIRLKNLPNFPRGIEDPTIYVVGTPENEAVSLGRMALSKDGKLGFQLARFHTGQGAANDMAAAVEQGLYVDGVQVLFESGIENESFGIGIIREGPKMEVEESIYRTYGINIPNTLAHCMHEETSDPGNPFGRTAVICPINCEGLNVERARLGIIYDNTASGMQHVRVMEEIIKRGGKQIETILLITPLLTDHGAAAISLAAAYYRKRTIFLSSAFLLDCIGPKRYFSPVPNDENRTAEPKMLEVNRSVLGEELVGKLCAGCNWTARLCAPQHAMDCSQKEIDPLGVRNEDLIENGLRIDPQRLKELGIDPKRLTPYSTFEEARRREINLEPLLK